jgi:hypothetical protein
MTLCLAVGLLDRHCYVRSLGHTNTHTPLFVANDKRGAETHALATGRYTRHAGEIQNLLIKLALFAFASLTARPAATPTPAGTSSATSVAEWQPFGPRSWCRCFFWCLRRIHIRN